MGVFAYALLLLDAATPVVVRHEPVDCFVADAFPRLEARVDPDDDVSRVRVRFHREDDERWYSVAMFRREGVWSAVLPKPRAGTEKVRYSIEAVDKRAGTLRSEEYAARVAESAAACPGERVAGLAVSPPLIGVEVPDGTRSLPKGFSGKNVLGSYSSGKPVKGRPRSALLGITAAAGAATGLALLKDPPTATNHTVAVEVIVVPRIPVSIRTTTLAIQVRVNLPLDLESGSLRMFLHTGSADATPSCASMSARVFQLRQFVPQIVTATAFQPSGACTPPFTVSMARAVLQDDSGGEKFRTGQTVPDLPLSLSFVP